MKILVAENDATGRKLLKRMLAMDGHEVVVAATGKETLQLFVVHSPDIVLLGTSLPDMACQTCSREIKRLMGKRFVFVILSSAVADAPSLAGFLESEADDFIDMPYNHVVLKAKLAGFERVRDLYRRLERFHAETEQEIKLAKHMFDTLTRRLPDNIEHIHHWTLAAGHFSGDLLIFERTPDDRLHILLGDFTGHGLAAAVGALPTSDIFFAMTRKGLPIADIAAEINRKLRHLLPTGNFCAASLLELDLRSERLDVWNGGLPPVLTIDDRQEIVHRIASRHLPLGILPDEAFDGGIESFSTAGAHHLVLYSDGLVEAQNPHGESFGEERLADALRSAIADHPLHRVKSHLVSFLDGLEPHDDVSMLAIRLAA